MTLTAAVDPVASDAQSTPAPVAKPEVKIPEQYGTGTVSMANLAKGWMIVRLDEPEAPAGGKTATSGFGHVSMRGLGCARTVGGKLTAVIADERSAANSVLRVGDKVAYVKLAPPHSGGKLPQIVGWCPREELERAVQSVEKAAKTLTECAVIIGEKEKRRRKDVERHQWPSRKGQDGGNKKKSGR